MNLQFKSLMDQATRLSQTGRLEAATQAIQRALQAASLTPPGRHTDTAARPPIFDGSQFDKALFDKAPFDKLLFDKAPFSGPLSTPTASPADVRFTTAHHSAAGLKRDYKLFVPTSPAEGPRPLVVMLHGCTQNPDDFAAGTAINAAAEAEGFYVLYPWQSDKANPQRCWNWFKHNHQSRGRGEPAILAGMTQQILTQHNIEADRVYVAGLSAGGAMAAILGAAYPDIYAAVGVHSGLAAGSAIDLPSALAAMQGAGKPASGAPSGMPTIVFHGDADATVHPNNGATVIASSVARGTEADQRVVHGPNGRSSTRTTYRRHDGHTVAEHWVVHGGAHAWSGGCANGSYTDARGPDATTAMLTFFFQHRRDSASVFRRQASGQSA